MARGPQRSGAQCSCIGCIGSRPALLAHPAKNPSDDRALALFYGEASNGIKLKTAIG